MVVAEVVAVVADGDVVEVVEVAVAEAEAMAVSAAPDAAVSNLFSEDAG